MEPAQGFCIEGQGASEPFPGMLGLTPPRCWGGTEW
jgi:hypothetical protein